MQLDSYQYRYPSLFFPIPFFAPTANYPSHLINYYYRITVPPSHVIMDISPSAPFEAQPPRSAGLPNAKDMSHHINRVTRNRQASSLKELYKYMSIPGMVLCAGGGFYLKTCNCT